MEIDSIEHRTKNTKSKLMSSYQNKMINDIIFNMMNKTLELTCNATTNVIKDPKASGFYWMALYADFGDYLTRFNDPNVLQ